MGRNVSGILLTGGALAAAILLLTLLPLSTAAQTQPQLLFRPMEDTLPTTGCPPNTAQRFDQDDDGPARLLDRTDLANFYSGALMVPAVFAGRQAWLILRITAEFSPPNELHELFLTNERGETIFLGVINEAAITPIVDLVFQIPQDFLTAGMHNITLHLDETPVNQDPNVITTGGADTGDITIDSMRVCYGGYFVFHIPLTCGFTPVDLNATGAPTYRAPAIKQGDYGTNILIRNPDRSLPTMRLNYSLYVEFVTRTSIGLPAAIKNIAVNNTFGAGEGTLDAMRSNFTSCDSFMPLVRSRTGATDPNDLLFWKGTLIITQAIGNGTTQTKLPLDVQAVYSYELTVNKIRYQILWDPSGTIPRHLIGQDLEMIIALSPANKTNLNVVSPFDSFQTMKAMRENIRTQYPAAADRATIRVIEANVGVGSSQTITHIQPTEAPLERPT